MTFHCQFNESTNAINNCVIKNDTRDGLLLAYGAICNSVARLANDVYDDVKLVI